MEMITGTIIGSVRWCDRLAGDLCLGWEESQDQAVLKVIEAKMKQGVRFFQLATFDGLIEVKRIQDIIGRDVRIADADIAKLFTDGNVGVFKKIAGAAAKMLEGSRLITDPAEVVHSHTMAVRQFTGG